jgi:hypothetical protein
VTTEYYARECDLPDHRTWSHAVLTRGPCQNIKSKVTILALQTTVTSVRHYLRVYILSCPRSWQLDRTESLHPPGHPVTATVLKDTCMYELSFVGHDPASKGSQIPMVRRLMGQVMLGSDYALTWRHLSDERNHPFHLQENPNNARTNIRARILITLQCQLKGMSTAAAVRIFLSADK